MRKLVAAVLLGTLALALAPLPVHASVAGDLALALGVLAVFNVLFVPLTLAAQPVDVAPAPPVVYRSAPVVQAPPRASFSREAVYPHGRYVLYGDGVTRAYQWIWIPNPPPPGSAPGY